MKQDSLGATIAAYDAMAAEYDRRWSDSDTMQDFVRLFANSVPPGGSVLDAACGVGRDALQLAEAGLDVVGVDLSRGMVEIARRKFPEFVARVMDLRCLKYPAFTFDGVICLAALHHLSDEDLQRALREIHRVLKPGGCFFATAKAGSGVETDAYGRVAQLRSQREIEEALNAAGFQTREIGDSTDYRSRPWLQVRATAPEQSMPEFEIGCPFCVPTLNIEMNADRLPAAGSVLWGDEVTFVTVDRSPLVPGHLLICSTAHVHSMAQAPDNGASIMREVAKAKAMLEHLYGDAIALVEHGAIGGSGESSCIIHAHIHLLPMSGEIAAKLRDRLAPLVPFSSLADLRAETSGREYILFSTTDKLMARIEGVAELPSQFFRMVVAEELGSTEYRWAPSKNDPDTISRFLSTLSACLHFLDQEEGRWAFPDVGATECET